MDASSGFLVLNIINQHFLVSQTLRSICARLCPPGHVQHAIHFGLFPVERQLLDTDNDMDQKITVDKNNENK